MFCKEFAILLGLVAKQEENTRELKASVDVVKERVGRVESRLDGVDRRLEDLDGRLIAFEQSVNNRFEAVDKKLDQVLQLLKPGSQQET